MEKCSGFVGTATYGVDSLMKPGHVQQDRRNLYWTDVKILRHRAMQPLRIQRTITGTRTTPRPQTTMVMKNTDMSSTSEANTNFATMCMTRRGLLRALFAVAITGSGVVQPEASDGRVVLADRDAGERIIKTASGLQYYDFVTVVDTNSTTDGTGDDGVKSSSNSNNQSEVMKGDTVRIEYTLGSTGARNGWRIDTGELSFRVGDGVVVKGLEEGVMGMKQGGRRRLLIPAELGYVSNQEQPIPKGFAEFQRFKNLYLNPDRPYKPDVVFDVTLLKIRR